MLVSAQTQLEGRTQCFFRVEVFDGNDLETSTLEDEVRTMTRLTCIRLAVLPDGKGE